MLRIAAPGDAEALMALINAAFIVERSFIDGDRVRLDEVLEFQRRGAFLVYGDMAASVYMEVNGGRCYFGLLSVDPARQGSGLGRRMVDAAAASAAASGWISARSACGPNCRRSTAIWDMTNAEPSPSSPNSRRRSRSTSSEWKSACKPTSAPAPRYSGN